MRRGGPRAENAVLLVDDCLQRPISTVRQVQRHLRVTDARAHALVAHLVALGVLRQYTAAVYDRVTAPEVLAVLLLSNRVPA